MYMISAGFLAFNVHRGNYGMATFNFMVALWLLLKTEFRN